MATEVTEEGGRKDWTRLPSDPSKDPQLVGESLSRDDAPKTLIDTGAGNEIFRACHQRISQTEASPFRNQMDGRIMLKHASRRSPFSSLKGVLRLARPRIHTLACQALRRCTYQIMREQEPSSRCLASTLLCLDLRGRFLLLRLRCECRICSGRFLMFDQCGRQRQGNY